MKPFQNHILWELTVAINLSVKSVPDHVADRLRRRAARNHRSLQGELLSILPAAAEAKGALRPAELLATVRRAGLQTPAESAAILRADRDAHERARSVRARVSGRLAV